MKMITPIRACCALAMVSLISIVASGQVIPIDDFDDMDPTLPGWTLADLSAGQPWGRVRTIQVQEH